MKYPSKIFTLEIRAFDARDYLDGEIMHGDTIAQGRLHSKGYAVDVATTINRDIQNEDHLLGVILLKIGEAFLRCTREVPSNEA